MQTEEVGNKQGLKSVMHLEGESDDFVNLDMYNLPPVEHFSYSGLSNVCQQRIDLYKELERYLEEHRSSEDKREFYLGIARIIQKSQARFINDKIEDQVSHWVLKLVFNNLDQGVFLINEAFIFIGRLYDRAHKYALTRAEGLNDEEKMKSQKEYVKRFYFNTLKHYIHGDESAEENVIRIPFKFAARLIEKYEVDLEGGYAIITPDSAFIVIQELFGEILHLHNKNVERIYKQIVKADARLEKLVDLLREYNKSTEHYYKSDKPVTTSKIDATNVEYLSKEYFPLCMSEILDGLKTKHQLKHWGRLQLGLFLKGIGMRMEDNIIFFNNHLGKLSDASKKIQEYKYYLEHMYGKRGKKTDYTPWSCQKIADKAIPTSNDIYGCPFKFYSDSHLAKALKSRNLDEGHINEVLGARKVAFNLGCRRMFELTHNIPKAKPGVGRHPNSYYLNSYFAKNRNKEHTSFNNLTA